MTKEITEFVVIAPATMGKSVEYAEDRILTRLSRSFPGYSFQIEPFGPFVQENEFSVIPMMGVVGEGTAPMEPGETLLDRYPPKWLMGAIKEVLREFELAPGLN